MNKNIEVISKHAWAVDFRLIPYISEIDYEPDPEFPAYEEIARLTGSGIILFNKAHKGYAILKKVYLAAMKEPSHQLRARVDVLDKNTEPVNLLVKSMYECELERRAKAKKSRWGRVKLWQR